MSAERITYELLAADASLGAIVSGRIYPVVLPLGETTPAVVYMVDGRTERPKVNVSEPTVHVGCQVTVMGFAKDYAVLSSIMREVRSALSNRLGNFGGTLHTVVRPVAETEDNYVDDLGLFSRAARFSITFTEST